MSTIFEFAHSSTFAYLLVSKTVLMHSTQYTSNSSSNISDV
jgi:hypothetical protein